MIIENASARSRQAASWLNRLQPAAHAGAIDEFANWAWPLNTLAEGVTQLAHQAGLAAELPTATTERIPPIPLTNDKMAFSQWLTQTTQHLGCDAQAVLWHFGDLDQIVRQAAPALLRIPETPTAPTASPSPRFLLLRKGGRRPVLLTPDRGPVRVSAARLSALLQDQASGDVGVRVEQLLQQTDIAAGRIAKAKAALVAEQMRDQHFGGCWLLRVAPHRPTWQHLRHSRLPRYLLLLLGLTLLQQLFTLVSWRYIGQGVFQAGFSAAGLTAWALILFTAIPFSLLATWAQINITLNLSRFARLRLLQGILKLNPATIRHLGAGQFLERVMQTESFQTLLLGGGFGVINALIQIGAAAVILPLGIGGLWHSLLLALWLLLTVGLSFWYARLFLQWRTTYRVLTNDLVERMVAHRTRLAQEEKTTWHLAEDEQLAAYHLLTGRLDSRQRLLNSLLNRGWLLVGLAGLVQPISNGVDAPARLAISLAGILLAGSAFAALRSALVTLVTLYATWRDIGPLFRSADQPPSVGTARYLPPINQGTTTTTQQDARPAKPLLMAHDLQFRYQEQTPLALKAVDLTIYPGDRLLLEGPSGGGKSTLASLLVGLQRPNSGVLLLHGLDQATVGLTNWRQRVIAAPQFHENHVLTESFGFNLLMGRRWPPTAEDLQEATNLCHELGLGDLLARMPGGLMQMVGESGWQLSHGERSRLFIARTLLQESDLIVLDESFAALDPETLAQTLACVLKRAPTLLVIAHP